MPQSISGFSTGRQCPSMRTSVGEVGRRVEAGGQDAVGVAHDHRGIALAGAVGAVHLQLLEQRVE